MPPDPTPPTTRPVWAILIGLVSAGLIAMAVWFHGRDRNWRFWMDVTLGIGGVLFCLETLLARKGSPPAGGSDAKP